MSYSIWRFKTRNFIVSMNIEDEPDPDFSFDETGETAREVDTGKWQSFAVECSVTWRGRSIGADYLGGCIYADPKEFRDHIGMMSRIHGSYFSDTVRTAVSEARKEVARLKVELPVLRAT